MKKLWLLVLILLPAVVYFVRVVGEDGSVVVKRFVAEVGTFVRRFTPPNCGWTRKLATVPLMYAFVMTTPFVDVL